MMVEASLKVGREQNNEILLLVRCCFLGQMNHVVGEAIKGMRGGYDGDVGQGVESLLRRSLIAVGSMTNV